MTFVEATEVLGNLGGLLGSIAVVVTLFYVSTQIKQASRSVRASAHQMGASFNGEVFENWISNPELVSIYLKGNERGLDGLDENERFRMVTFCNKAMRYFEHMYFLHREEALPAGFWEGQRQSLQELLGDPGFCEAWDINKRMFSPDFQTLVAGLPAGRGMMPRQ